MLVIVTTLVLVLALALAVLGPLVLYGGSRTQAWWWLLGTPPWLASVQGTPQQPRGPRETGLPRAPALAMPPPGPQGVWPRQHQRRQGQDCQSCSQASRPGTQWNPGSPVRMVTQPQAR